MAIVGRSKEINELNELYNSEKSEFVVASAYLVAGSIFYVESVVGEYRQGRETGCVPRRYACQTSGVAMLKYIEELTAESGV